MIIKFTSTDAIILQSLYSGGGLFNRGVDLEAIVRQGDAIDRTVFQITELKEGLEKLLAIGFIEFQNNKIYSTKLFRQRKKVHCKWS